MEPEVWAARVRRLAKRFGDVFAVDDVSFDVKPGELLTLLGPSGCGKTTTMRAIAGLERIDAGEILIKDRVMNSAARGVHVAPERRDVGMVFQSYAIWPHMTVFENVAYPLRCRQVARRELRERVEAGLNLVEMSGFEERPATLLSGGQQQRVALARALVMQPSVLLLDEPLSNLDAKLRVHMRAHIKELQAKTGLTMVYVTHDQLEAMALSDRIIVMQGGRIEQIGSPEAIYERPSNLFVADFVGAINLVKGAAVGSRQDEDTIAVSVGRDTLLCALGGAPAPAPGSTVLVMIRPEKIAIEIDGSRPAMGSARAGIGPVNRISGQVTAAVYCGDHREFSLDCAGLKLRVTGPNDLTVSIGAPVDVVCSARDLRVLRDDAARASVAPVVQDSVPASTRMRAAIAGTVAP
jgi:ABC-type Fe3+/spermidine/putrescine transport system ATPase subunit